MKTHRFSNVIRLVLVVCCLASVTTARAQSGGNGKVTIAVTSFGTSEYYYPSLRQNLGAALVNELVNNGRFTVVDRARVNAAIEEQGFGLTGFVDGPTAAKTGRLLGAQFLITLTPINFSEKSGRVCSFCPRIPGIDRYASSYSAKVKFNLQIIDSTSGVIVFSKQFNADQTAFGMNSYGSGGWLDIDGFRSNAMPNAVEKGMKNAVLEIIQKIGSVKPVIVATPVPPETTAKECAIPLSAKNKRIMVVIPETHISQRIPDPAGETEIIKRLVAQGFNVIDQSQIAAIRNREKVLTAINNPQAAAALGVEFRADIIIIGEAFSEFSSRQGRFVSTRARVEARAIQTDTARILATDGKFGTGLDVAEFVSAKGALRNAGGEWADYFIGQMCESSSGSASSTSGVEILISNISWDQLSQFARNVERIAGVRKVSKSMTLNVARLDIQFDGSTEKVADAISSARFGQPRVNIIGVSGNKIEIEIAK
ncbi:MAG: hypothetical protein IPL32_05810 [Chloracidobacterium sp.]|nr:hypothetical protein [Chloracidobacterium sp.]